jgi:hypothetical protein
LNPSQIFLKNYAIETERFVSRVSKGLEPFRMFNIKYGLNGAMKIGGNV